MSRRAWVLMGVLAALWGASYLFIKVALDDLDAPAIVFARTALAALVLAPVALARDALRPLRGLLGPLLLLAVVQVSGPFLLITFGEREISSSLTGILVASAPIWTALLAVRFAAEDRPRGLSAVGVLVGIAGVVLLLGVDLSGDAAALLGGLAVLLAGLGYAIGGLYLRARLAGTPPVGVATATMGLSALLLVPTVPFTVPDGVGPDTAGAVLALGIGGTGIAFLLFYTLIAELGAPRASVVAYLAPGFAVVYGAVLLDERITVATLAGLALILAGSYLAAGGRAAALRGAGARRRAAWR